MAEEPSLPLKEEKKPLKSSARSGRSIKGRKIIINVSDTKYPVVRTVARKILGWKLSRDEEDENWDVWWTDAGVPPEKFSKMRPYQKINHFPGMVALSRKN
jgi:tubulin polyglutamylase TTLL6/13